ncbi:hypothetical protein [Streptosporangium sp. NPDC000396]|uniref:hypothetical protein n=1 Tax=Streptosporangium sp. NPDC000396 TaxID=3366185 RepID=UPI00368249D3
MTPTPARRRPGAWADDILLEPDLVVRITAFADISALHGEFELAELSSRDN